ncbi:MAG: IS1 family transposase [Bacteroidales bacterium]|jgi:IS1 family transposase
MNNLPLAKKVQIINLLVEGNSLRSTSRITGCSINTVTKLLVDVGKACQDFHNEKVIDVRSKRVQCDEIWSFVYAKKKNIPEELKRDGIGDVWTWTGIDADSKLVVSWLVGNRDAETADIFIKDIAYRLKNKVQLTTDGLSAYIDAVEDNMIGKVDYAQLIKLYGNEGASENDKRYSPAECTGTIKNKIIGKPKNKYISTSYIERQNLTMRMSMRRFTRLTNGFSKKIENHCHAIALNFVYYNFCRIHKTLRVTPAYEAGITKEIMTIEDIVKLTLK